jgi:FKBP-type peptidyl-prolyl cis-trans isomerase
MHAAFGTAWVQRNNGSWKNITDGPEASPAINLISNVDSTDQFLLETKTIQQAIANGMTDAKNVHEGIYYNMMKEGHGNTVSATDTVVIHYKGYLFSDGSIFDQTRDKPATFPLGRLIKGWQIGVPLCKIGGKIKLVIPSAQAYSIRTRSPKIPPNSTLVFEIEVLDAKPFQRP